MTAIGPAAAPKSRNHLWDVVDPVCGVVREILTPVLPDGAPPAFHSRVAVVGDTRQFAHWLADRVGGGTSWQDPAAARIAALGEAVERYCGNHIPEHLRVATSEELRAARVPHLGPADLPAFGVQQLARSDFPYIGWDQATPVHWTTGIGQDGDEILVPAPHVYLNFASGPRRAIPRIVHLQYSGIAAGDDLASAADRAVAEIVERDALVAWWTLGLPGQAIDPASVPQLQEYFAGTPLRCSLVALPSEFGLPVVAALLSEDRFRLHVMGLAAAVDPAAAALKAAGEAVQVWTSARGLTDPDGTAFQAVEQGIFSPKVFLPFRADRRYLDDAGESFEHVKDLAAQVQVWLDPALHHLAARFAPGPALPAESAADGAVSAAAPPGTPRTRVSGIAELRARLAATGREPITVDLTTSDVAEAGWRVARVVIPRMLTNAPAAFTYLGTPRLHELADRHRVSAQAFTLAPPPHN